MKLSSCVYRIVTDIYLILLIYVYLKVHHYYFYLTRWEWHEDRQILSLLFISFIFFVSVTALFIYTIFYNVGKYRSIEWALYFIYFCLMSSVFIVYLPRKYI
ncbi:hypothetical protein F888_03145 [Acinetobacter courvalinii]|uniref:Uncharacterized protein n=1 Tax=Acinetobacter courvalinii TaxID=280147 RepID=N9PWC1_9GAMM|nr:hypothetical protein F888_03145 [Acinetobacter courvalinii]KAB0659111.1 hypothetical protein F7P77_15805 [Acinetobacter courvalinii]RSN81768.1 hypothetical protein EA770_11810 [Acinetobacter baumannii]